MKSFCFSVIGLSLLMMGSANAYYGNSFSGKYGNYDCDENEAQEVYAGSCPNEEDEKKYCSNDCPNRHLWKKEGVHYCEMTDKCALNECPEDYPLRSKDGDCMSCDEDSSFEMRQKDINDCTRLCNYRKIYSNQFCALSGGGTLCSVLIMAKNANKRDSKYPYIDEYTGRCVINAEMEKLINEYKKNHKMLH